MNNHVKNVAKQNRTDFLKFIILLIFFAACVAVTIWLMPWIISLKNESGRQAFQDYIRSKGAWGVLILLGVHMAQVVIAFIPGEPIEVVSGLLYGTFGGWAICTVGALIGTIIIFYLVKFLGTSFIRNLIGEKKIKRFKFLQNARQLETITFLLFFIPGTPKDVLTYFMPLTKIKPLTFFSICTVARIPSIISSTFAGASIGQGKWMQTIVIFVLIGVAGIIGIRFNQTFLDKINRHREKRKKVLKNDKK